MQDVMVPYGYNAEFLFLFVCYFGYQPNHHERNVWYNSSTASDCGYQHYMQVAHASAATY
ncbi:hypothetical protein FRACYDRAFT_271860 [Fragilariopsis cylindrus CCMP1102]|uniref:Uncharacterized protein n=1 Tax=Fragilariopsis cylindrus CCMP1102 TaxID=635003 RepID=A0A1E7EQ93_9STRA|nr:hypothetical protein FRACYDRAFT_271860 [Fragilariopsis cylindrus CCMP1102]|eukprot:OEU08160.1 hypothetical protein FRACYDRAFT_271860 [Fragilariopsis cylindrus CCMP1102]